jgi:hypothetical protein
LGDGDILRHWRGIGRMVGMCKIGIRDYSEWLVWRRYGQWGEKKGDARKIRRKKEERKKEEKRKNGGKKKVEQVRSRQFKISTEWKKEIVNKEGKKT